MLILSINWINVLSLCNKCVTKLYNVHSVRSLQGQSIYQTSRTQIVILQSLFRDAFVTQVVQYHEKPEMFGPNYQKVTYVLYLKGKEDSLGKQEKEIQTSKTLTIARDVVVIDHPPKEHKVFVIL